MLCSHNLVGGGEAFEGRLREALLEAADYGLLVLDETVRQSIYSYIERKYKVKREEIPDRLEDFHKALEGTLGAGGKVVERIIAKDLCSRLNLKFTEHDRWTLIDYVGYAREAIGC